jgi:cytoskeletal protein CcmA (bactofilin family)
MGILAGGKPVNDRSRRLTDGRHDQPVTVIAPGARFEGRLSGRGCVVVSGRFEGDCDLEGSVTVAEGGEWQGSLLADDVVVAGGVAGDVRARERVEVGRQARITGTLSGRSVAIAEGAVIEGDVRVGAEGGEPPLRFRDRRQG